MSNRDSISMHPGDAMIAAWVLDILKSRGVLRRSAVAAAINRVSNDVPRHWLADQRVASLAALHALIEDPDSRGELPFKWNQDG